MFDQEDVSESALPETLPDVKVFLTKRVDRRPK